MTSATARRPNPARDAALDAAAEELNARGVSGASLSAIAGRVGLTRAALYYYFRDREDLVFECYRRSCEVTRGDLDAAARAADGLAKVLAYVRRALDPARPPVAVLSEVPYLSEAHEKTIEAEHAKNVETLRRFLDKGIVDRSIRACDAEIVAQTIVGILSWVPLSVSWLGKRGEVLRARAATAVSGLLRDGVAADPSVALRCPIDVTAFAHRPANAFDRREAKALKVDQLTKTASRLFNRHGVDGTSLDDVTAALGATKGAFYHYLRDKTELVLRCYERAFDLNDRFADAAEAAGTSGLERSMFGLHVNVQAHVADLSPLAPLTGVRALPAKDRRRLNRRARSLSERFIAFGHQGIADGSMRPYDVEPLAVAGAGAFSWIPKWLPAADARTPREIADEMMMLFANGLTAIAGAQPRSGEHRTAPMRQPTRRR